MAQWLACTMFWAKQIQIDWSGEKHLNSLIFDNIVMLMLLF